MRHAPLNTIARMVREALLEDIGPGDLSSIASIDEGARARGDIVAQQDLVAAGIEPAILCFRTLDPGAVINAASHGQRIGEGGVVLSVEGNARAMLAAERTALNFLARLCGIATVALRCVEEIRGLPCEVYGTRKTTPGWRWLEKDALEAGGARPHRMGLHDAVLLKDNHVALAGGVGACVRRARAAIPSGARIEVEVESLPQLAEALEAGADIILLDNMTLTEMAEAVRRARGRAELEASGGLTPGALRPVAQTGVNRISLGSLTHSAPAAALSMTMRPS